MTQNERVFTKEVTDTHRKMPALPFCARGKKTEFFSSKHKESLTGASLREDVRRSTEIRSDNSRYKDEWITRRRSVDGLT